MTTRLSHYCQGVMEAAWLAAVLVLPVYFNVYSSRIFEPDKIGILRALAVIVLAAWIVKALEEAGPGFRESAMGLRWSHLLRSAPLLWVVGAYTGVFLLATVFSINPRISLWGSYARMQGGYTTLAYLVIFAAMVGNIRTPAQVERVITMAILSSLPVSLYGLLQRANLDPIPWQGDIVHRIAANMGNSIFVAAYLIMVIPLTLVRGVQAIRAIFLREDRAIEAVRAGVYLILVGLQMTALYFSGSRGPWLGFLTSLFFLALFFSLHWRRFWLTLGVVGVSVALAVFLVVLNIPGGPLEGLRTEAGFGRLGKVFETQTGTGRVRVLIWEGAAKLVAPHEPMVYPDGRADRWNAIRPLIGYGPESMHMAFNPFYPPELGHLESRNASPDRSHNETWDALVMMGFLGLVVNLGLYGSVLYFGLRWLGWMNTRLHRWLFLGMFLGGGAMAAAGMVWWQGIGFLGVGLPFGMILGLIFYLTLIALVPRLQPQRSSVQGARIYLLIGLLSAIMAHFVEIHFGIAIVVTRTYFWVFTGLMLIVGMGLSGDTSQGESPDRALERKELAARGSGQGTARRRRTRRKSRVVSTAVGKASLWGSSVLWGGGALALLIATLGFDFLSNPTQMTRAGSIIWYSLTRLPREGEPVSWGVFALVMITWLGGGILVWAEHRPGEAPVLRHLPELWLLSAGLDTLYWFWHAGSLAASTRLAMSGQMDLMDHLEGFLHLLGNYYLFLIVLVALGGVVLVAEWPQRMASRPMLNAFLGLVVLGGMVFLLQRLSLHPIQADMAFKLGEPFTQSRRWSLVISLYQRATQLAPMEDHYYLFKGRAYLDQARAAQSEEESEAWMLQAEDSLKQALRLNPLNPDHTANLARLFTVWSSITRNDDELRRVRAKLAEEYYRRALRLSPNNVGLWVELGSLYLNQMQNPDAALEVLTQAIQVDAQYDRAHAVMGEYYLQQSRSEEGRDRMAVLEKAAEQFQMALDLASENARQDRYSYTVNLGAAYAEMGDLAQSIAAYERALEILPTASDAWRVEEALAGLYGQSGLWDKALLHTRAAWQLAPEEQRPRLSAMIETILGLLPDE